MAARTPERLAKPSAQAPRFVDDYLPALLAQASQLISSEFHEVVRRQGFHSISIPSVSSRNATTRSPAAG